MNSVRHCTLLWALSASSVAGNAQFVPKIGRLTPDQIAQIVKNTMKLQVSIKLDRDVYFPGEEPGVTITVQNPTAQILEVLSPFQTGGLNLLKRDPSRLKSSGSEWVYLSPHPVGGGERSLDSASRLINPGEKVQVDYSSPAGCMDKNMGMGLGWTNCYFPESEGEYQLEYNYPPGTAANFSIVWPKLEQWTEVVLQKPHQRQEIDINLKPTGRAVLHERRIRAAVLGYLGNHILVVSVSELSGDPRIHFDVNGMFTGFVSRYFGVHRRLVTSATAITALQATADAAENVTITYTEQGGQRFTLKLDPDRHLIP